jgi:hypothetical protein
MDASRRRWRYVPRHATPTPNPSSVPPPTAEEILEKVAILQRDYRKLLATNNSK